MESQYKDAIFKAFFQQGLLRHQLDSFNYFIDNIVPDCIKDNPEFIYETDKYHFSYHFDNVYVHKPSITECSGKISDITPHQARLRSISYSSPLFVSANKNFTDKVTNKAISTREQIMVGMVPIMVKSKYCMLFNVSPDELAKYDECEYDQGGYFIINGMERVIVGIERMATNQVYVFPNKTDPSDIKAEISAVEEKARRTSIPFSIHLVPISKMGRRSLYACCPQFKKEFPLGMLLKALNCIDDLQERLIQAKPMRNMNCETSSEVQLKTREIDVILATVWEEVFNIKDAKTAKEYMANISIIQPSTQEKNQMYVDAILQNDFLPHLGFLESDLTKKVDYIFYMVKKLLAVYSEQRKFDDHDHYKNKRIDQAGILLGSIFRQAWGQTSREMQIMIKKKVDNSHGLHEIMLSQLVNHLTLTKHLTYALSTGNWGISRSAKVKTGVSQILNRFNYQAYLSHCRRITNPMPKNSILSKPRQAHNSCWGYVDWFETPEGEGIGLIKNKTLQSRTSLPSSEVMILTVIEQFLLKNGELLVFLNGKTIGRTNPETYNRLRILKLYGGLPYDTGIVYNRTWNEMFIWSDSGRMIRPLLTVKDGKTKLTEEYVKEISSGRKHWNDFLIDGVIEYVDTEEQEHYLIANDDTEITKNHTHVEISSSLLLGAATSIIPFANHDPAARATYQCLWKEEPVLMADGSYLPIKDICVGDEIVSFDEKTMEPSITRVAFHFVRKTEKLVYRIITETGRGICATYDHLFMTNKGWCAVQDFDDDTALCIADNAIMSDPYENYNWVPLEERRIEMNIAYEYIHTCELTDIDEIADITTESDTHTFIAGSGFCVHNSSMSKQSVSVPMTNFMQRMDGIMHVLHYPQKSLCQTQAMDGISYNDLPGGTNAVTFICSYGGWNQEDAIIMNQSSVDRGLFHSTFYRTYKDQESKIPGAEESFGNPKEGKGLDKLGPNGIVRRGVTVKEGDIIIGKVSSVIGVDGQTIKPKSTFIKHGESGVVDTVYVSVNPDGTRSVKVRIRCMRIPKIGDKFAAEHSQKGVIGMLMRQEDLPFTASGMVPDIIINPCSQPSRMTIGHMIEFSAGKLAACSGELQDATVFRKRDIESIGEELHKMGMNRHGWEVVYNGMTGEQMQALVYTGSCHYQRLRHMVDDKWHCRGSKGPIIPTTRQPSEGRSREGGLRVGEKIFLPQSECKFWLVDDVIIGNILKLQGRLEKIRLKEMLNYCYGERRFHSNSRSRTILY